jgi:hypothetical protein
MYLILAFICPYLASYMQTFISRAILLASIDFHLFPPSPIVTSQEISITKEDVSLQLNLQKFHDYFNFECTI